MTKGKQPLPKHLEWVYIYIGKNSKEVGYVGRAKNSSRVEKRVVEHRKEAWYWSEEWELKFCPCLNRCESEYLETIYINKLHAKYNKDKKYTMILSKSGDNILYADKGIDITNDVIAGLNKAYKKGAAKAEDKKDEKKK